MAVEVKIPVPLRRFVGGNSYIECSSGKVIEILKEIGGKYPEFYKKFFDEEGNLKQYINLLVNGKNIKELKGVDTLVKDDQKVMILLAVGGG